MHECKNNIKSGSSKPFFHYLLPDSHDRVLQALLVVGFVRRDDPINDA